jgi:hypothetical protein
LDTLRITNTQAFATFHLPIRLFRHPLSATVTTRQSLRLPLELSFELSDLEEILHFPQQPQWQSDSRLRENQSTDKTTPIICLV